MRITDTSRKGTKPVHVMFYAFLALMSLLLPESALAESADVEAAIESVDTDKLTLKLDDGKTYQAPEEFNFEGLEKGVKVIVFYTEIDGKRIINDLEVQQ
jgi:hypothetical protein